MKNIKKEMEHFTLTKGELKKARKYIENICGYGCYISGYYVEFTNAFGFHFAQVTLEVCNAIYDNTDIQPILNVMLEDRRKTNIVGHYNNGTWVSNIK